MKKQSPSKLHNLSNTAIGNLFDTLIFVFIIFKTNNLKLVIFNIFVNEFSVLMLFSFLQSILPVLPMP